MVCGCCAHRVLAHPVHRVSLSRERHLGHRHPVDFGVRHQLDARANPREESHSVRPGQGQYALGIANALQHFASLGAVRGQAHDAARLIRYVNGQYAELGSEREYTEKWGYDKLMAVLRERLSEAEIEELAAEGAAWSEDQALTDLEVTSLFLNRDPAFAIRRSCQVTPPRRTAGHVRFPIN
jgi:hypothetical protein